MDTENQISASARLVQLISGYWTSCCIYVAIKLNIADIIADTSKTATEIATETKSHPPSVFRFLRALCSIGILQENDKKEFSLTPSGQLLRSGVNRSLKAYALMLFELTYKEWGNLLHSVRTGESAFKNIHKMDVLKYIERHPEQNEIFYNAMAGMTSSVTENILAAYDFSSLPTIVDVGSGNGALLCGILKNSPNSRGIVFDSDEYVGHQAIEFVKKNNLEDRCYFESGSFFDKIPGGASAYLLKSILHDWDDESCLKILANVRKAMLPGSRLLVIEGIIPDNNNLPHFNYFMDINMMVMSGGKQRTLAELRTLIEKAGLTFSRMIPLNYPMYSIIEAMKQ